MCIRNVAERLLVRIEGGGHPLHLHTEHEPHSTNPYWPGSPSFAAMMFHLGHVATRKNQKIQNIQNFKSYNVC